VQRGEGDRGGGKGTGGAGGCRPARLTGGTPPRQTRRTPAPPNARDAPPPNTPDARPAPPAGVMLHTSNAKLRLVIRPGTIACTAPVLGSRFRFRSVARKRRV